jgi:hypothetical protein
MRRALLIGLVVSLGFLSRADWSFAISPTSSWADIRSTPNILVEAPMIWFGTHAVPVLEVCRSGDTLRAVTSEGVTAEVPEQGDRSGYDIRVDRIVGSIFRTREVLLFTKHYEIPPCR